MGEKHTKARLYGYKLMVPSHGAFPVAVKDKDESKYLVGTLIWWEATKDETEDQIFSRKMRRADHINGYDPNPEKTFYTKTLVSVQIDGEGSSGESELAYTYYMVRIPLRARPLECGDWLKRDEGN